MEKLRILSLLLLLPWTASAETASLRVEHIWGDEAFLQAVIYGRLVRIHVISQYQQNCLAGRASGDTVYTDHRYFTEPDSLLRLYRTDGWSCLVKVL